jgi:glycosyltransferase involved in cell wall biosynthesis
MRAQAAPPTVGIGMPVFNGERYLEPAIASILSQSFTGF